MSSGDAPQTLKQITIYTDGAAVPSLGNGGYGVVLRFGEHASELSGGFKQTTNNRMELMAVIAGLEALKERCKVTLHSDSQYIVNAITSGLAFRWRDNGWTLREGGIKKIKNPDLWERLLTAYERHEVEVVCVKGHAGITANERCDALAMGALGVADLPADPGYVDTSPNEAPDASGATPLPNRSTKIAAEGQACRNCGTPVVKRTPKQRKAKPGQEYYFAWYLYCENCKTQYMVEEAKQFINRGSELS